MDPPLPTPPASAEHMLDIWSESESIASDTIVVRPADQASYAYARHMPTPPSNQAQGLAGGRKRYYSQTDNSEDDTQLRVLEDDIRALKKRLAEAKRQKRLLAEKESLQRQLAEL